MTAPHEVTIEMEGPGRGSVTLDGKPLCVQSFTLSGATGELTELTVTLLVSKVNQTTTAEIVRAKILKDLQTNGPVAKAFRSMNG